MQALRWHGKRDIRHDDVSEPSPGRGQVKAKINLAGICGTDLKEYTDGPVIIPVNKAPLTMGHEFAGEVVELGEGVTDFKVGDRVTGVCAWPCGDCFYCKSRAQNLCLNQALTGFTEDGSMAEYFVAPSSTFYKLPDSVCDEEGCLVEPLAVALHAVRQGRVQPGDTVAVVGEGTIGLCALLAARAAGASEVYVVAKHKGRGERALAFGATEVVYFHEGNPKERLGALTDGFGVDISIECVGRPETPQLSVDILRKGGTAVIVGVFEKPSAFHFASVLFNQITIVGSPIYVDEARAAISLLADKRIDPTGLISLKVPLKDAVEEGFEKLLKSKEEYIKIVLEVP